jgi:hypothetical protein
MDVSAAANGRKQANATTPRIIILLLLLTEQREIKQRFFVGLMRQ